MENQCLSLQDLRRWTPRPVCLQQLSRGVIMMGGLPSGWKEKGSFLFLLWFQAPWEGGAVDVNTVEGAQPCWVSRSLRDPALMPSWTTGAFLTPACASSGAGPGDLTSRSCDHSPRTWMASLPCVCGNAWSVHPSGQTSRCSLPTCICRASLLEETKTHKLWGSILFL